MGNALVFGGLSSAGAVLTDALLDQGIEVYPVSSALSETELNVEAEQELRFGRHAFFHRSEEISMDLSVDSLYLMDAFRTIQEDNDRLKQKLQELLSKGDLKECRFIFFLSSLEIYGEKRAQANSHQRPFPVNSEGIAANQMEIFFVRAMIKLKPLKSVICRTDRGSLHASQNGKKLAHYITRLAAAGFSGLKTTQYFPDQPDESPLNQEFIQLTHF
ncbi:MAG: hypothetical protein ACE3JK_19145 [Sporolactobacillus sp.]